ncbi:hypothetical protein PJF56_01375 [Roseofilum sp. BLCC_M91]|uniref:Uncharacterized protein n=1 Tax=Roseofilum halophilum BLCC-M91 TaxID=3022259 RepID=A0ABT7BEA7_9CYAN|nr:hypothetical protein [Roseofilum halophilum]MDJ1177505.1 hypothetical protein [Roseofilum halophilum BLCC-M91]
MDQSAINNHGITQKTQETLRHRIRPIVEHFLKTDEVFADLEGDRALDEVLDVFLRNGNEEELQQMSDEVMTEKVRRILGTNMLFGLLSDLTPEEMQEFDAALLDLRKGRS